MEQRKVTLQDVAAEAGTSLATASRVLGKEQAGLVRPELQARVRAAAERLQYRHSFIASTLGRGRSRTIGVLMRVTDMPVSVGKLNAVERAVWREGYDVLLVHCGVGAEAQIRAMERLSSYHVAGAICAVEPDPGVAEALQRVATGIPVVTLLPIPAAFLDCVTVDRAHGAYLAARHLIGLGHRRLGAVMPLDLVRGAAAAEITGSPPPAGLLHPNVHQRLEGLRQACREAGCPLDEHLVSYQTEGTYDGGYAGARALWQQRRQPPTALLCSNDQTAIGALMAFQEMGVRVPAQVALVGFDNLPEAAYARVPLTTLAQPVEQEARRAVSLLFERLRAPEPRKEVVTVSLPPQLIVRQSCGARPAAEKENGSRLDPHPTGRGNAMQPLLAHGAKRR